MKIDHLIVQHLLLAKAVTLQGIGTIHLNPSVVLPSETDKDPVLPENAFTFDYNLRAGEDEALINFIVEKTRKMKPLATSDLESYSMLAKQFLNIGKPLLIEGVGTIQKNQAGQYEFIQGNYVAPKIDDIPKQLKEKTEENISFESESRGGGNTRKYAAVAFLVFFAIIAVLSGLGIYYFISKKKTAEPVAQAQLPIDTVPKIDTPKAVVPDTNIVASPPVPKDSFSFKVAVKEYKDSITAANKLKTFSSYGYKLLLIKLDTGKYVLAMPFTTPLSDTARTRDSLQKRIFGGNPYIVQQ